MIEHQFGKYTVVRRLGAGGMAEVFLCKLQGIAGFEKQLVVKRIRPDIASDGDFLTMFFDEARLAANLNHPNIIQTFEVDQIDGMPFIAMEYVNGATLSAVLKKHREEHRKTHHGYVAWVFAGVCAGLDYAHNAVDTGGRRLDIIHRDISPQNIIVSLDGTAKIFDFGVAKARGSLALTSANHIKGKFAYMAPEQLKALPTDSKADVYAVGVCLYEATTGRRPFSGHTEAELFAARLEGSFKKPSELIHKFPTDLEEIILDAMEADPRARPSAVELAERLATFCSGGMFAATATTVATWMREMFAEDSSAYEVYQSNLPAGMNPPQGSNRQSSSNLPYGSNLPVGSHVPYGAGGAHTMSLTPVPRARALSAANIVETAPRRGAMGMLFGMLLAATVVVLGLVVYRLAGRDRPESAAVADTSPPPVANSPPTTVAQQQAAMPQPQPQPAPAQPAQPQPTPEQAEPVPAPLPAAAVPAPVQEPATATVARTVDIRRAPNKAPKFIKAPPPARVTKATRVAALTESAGSAGSAGSGGWSGSGGSAGSAGSAASAGSGSAGSAGSGSAVLTTTHTVTQPTGSATTTITITSQSPQAITVNKAPTPALYNPGTLDAIPSIGNVSVDGSLTTSEVQSALSRAVDALRGCYRSAASSSKKTPDLSVKLTFEIDEGARATRVRVAGDTLGLGSCVKDAIGAVRTRVAPDVGTVSVSATVRFKPTR